MFPTNLLVGVTEDLLLELVAIELENELRLELAIELGALELGAELDMTLEERAEDTGPPLHTVPLTVGRSALDPFLLP